MAVAAEAAAGDDGALAGIKVLDVAGTIATGYCGKLFADHGRTSSTSSRRAASRRGANPRSFPGSMPRRTALCTPT